MLRTKKKEDEEGKKNPLKEKQPVPSDWEPVNAGEALGLRFHSH